MRPNKGTALMEQILNRDLLPNNQTASGFASPEP